MVFKKFYVVSTDFGSATGCTVKSGYLAHFVVCRTSSIRCMSYFCLNSTLHSLFGAHNLIKQKMGGAEY